MSRYLLAAQSGNHIQRTREKNMNTPVRVAMAEPIILALHLRFFGSSHAYTLLSHKPVSHPTRGKMSDMIRIDGYSLRSIAFHELTYSIKNTVAQTAPMMVPMA
ncbi:hypothetical protein, partial [Cutibacterium acnes]|uniref:hypothetical protein n=6 Tax=Cutibacterium acnes TaxID=1747 RepID=UPI0019505A68